MSTVGRTVQTGVGVGVGSIESLEEIFLPQSHSRRREPEVCEQESSAKPRGDPMHQPSPHSRPVICAFCPDLNLPFLKLPQLS